MIDVATYLASRLETGAAVELQGRLYNRPAPDGAFMTEFSNMRRFRGGRSDQIKDQAQIIRLQGPAVPRPVPYNETKRGIRHETGGDWYGRSARAWGVLQSDGTILVERLEYASPEWERWHGQQKLRLTNRGIYERQLEDPNLSEVMRRYAEDWLRRDDAHTDEMDPEPTFADPLAAFRPISHYPLPLGKTQTPSPKPGLHP